MCVLKKAQKTAQFPALQSLSSLGKNVPSAPYTHMLPNVAFDKGNSFTFNLTHILITDKSEAGRIFKMLCIYMASLN